MRASFLARMTATFFGVGYSPKAPGTLGSLASLPLIYVMSHLPPTEKIVSCVIVVLLACWASIEVCKESKAKDPQFIVIDEVAGMMIAYLLIPASFFRIEALPYTWYYLALPFILFRFFDITKLPPVGVIDRWSKRQTSPTRAGVGVVLDDVLAGIQALLVFMLFHIFMFSRTMDQFG